MNYTGLIDFSKKNRVLIAIIVLGILFRLYTIYDNNIFFYFDQSRDAVISRQIIEQRDIKIQGPSASGTNDSLYHGVLYYYLIGPLYTLFSGNPIIVSAVLGVLGGTTITTIYFLTKEITEDKNTALIATTLTSLSAHAALSATWLSNPQLALITVPLFYLYIWKIFKTSNIKFLPLVGLFLGLSNQAIIFSIYLYLPALIALIYLTKTHGIKKIIIPLSLTIATYLTTIATMLITQLQLARVGIFKISDIAGGGDGINMAKSIDSISQVYSELARWALFPSFPYLSPAITFLILTTILIYSSPKLRTFTLLWFVAPMALLIFQPRNSGHTLMGTLPMIYIATAIGLGKILHKKYGKILVPVLLLLYTGSNIYSIQTVHTTARHPMVIQFGATLKHQLLAIDDTYTQNAEFSLNTLAVPYKINTTWAYLYRWYGQSRYNRKPTFSGPNQSGLPGEGYLRQQSIPKTVHASIIEPLQGIPQFAQEEFQDTEAANAGKIIEQKKFGAITVQYRQK